MRKGILVISLIVLVILVAGSIYLFKKDFTYKEFNADSPLGSVEEQAIISPPSIPAQDRISKLASPNKQWTLKKLDGLQLKEFNINYTQLGNDKIKVCIYPKQQLGINDPIIQANTVFLRKEGLQVLQIQPNDMERETLAGKVVKLCFDVDPLIADTFQIGTSSAVYVYENTNIVEFQGNGFNFNSTLYKNLNGNWTNTNDIWTRFNTDKWKHGADDNYSNGWAEYKFRYESTANIGNKGIGFIIGNGNENYFIELYDTPESICNQQKLNGTTIDPQTNLTINKYETSGCIISQGTNNDVNWLEIKFFSNGTIDPSIVATTSYEAVGNNVTQRSIKTNPISFLETSESSPYNNLVIYYSFDKDNSTTAIDLSNREYNGRYNGNVNSSINGCIYDNCLQMDGTGDYINSGTFSWATSSRITVSLWVKTPGGTTGAAFGVGSDNYNRLQAHLPYSDNILYWDYGNHVGNGRISTSFSSYLNKWTHVALVSNGSLNNWKAIYINGALITSSTTSDGPTAITGLNVGRGLSGGTFDFTGSIDEFMIFNESLTLSEVQAIYNNQSARFKPRGEFAFKQQNITDPDNTRNRINVTFMGIENTLQSNISARVGFWNSSMGYATSGHGLVGYYPFDGDFTDKSGQGHHATTESDTIIRNVSAVFNTSAHTDGVGDAVDLGVEASLKGVDNFTVSLWTRPDTAAASSIKNVLGDAGSSNVLMDILWDTAEKMRCDAYLNGANQFAYANDYILNDQGWHHIVCRYNGSALSIWVDGVHAGQDSTATGPTQSGSNNLKLGEGVTNSNYDGDYDEVMFFANRSLTDEEIRELYYTGAIGKVNATVGINWKAGEYKNISTNSTFGGLVSDLPIGNGSTNILLDLRFTAGKNAAQPFYTPILYGNMSLDLFSVTEAAAPSNDTTPPTVTLNHHANGTTVNVSTVWFNATVSDNVNVSTATIQVWNASNHSLIASNQTTIGVASASFNRSLFIPADGTYKWNVLAVDNNTNQAYATNNFTFTLTSPVVDTNAPNVTSLTEYPLDPATYNISQVYQFNATVIDSSSLSQVLLEFGGVNRSTTSLGNVYTVSLNNLSAGVYNYRWLANDSSNNKNYTETGSFTINTRTPNGSISLSSSTVTYPTSTTATGLENNLGDGDLTYSLFRNNVSVANPNTETLAVGTWVYTFNTTGGQNYSSNTTLDTKILTVNKGTGAATLRLNNTQANITIGVGGTIRIDGNVTTGVLGSLNLSINGIQEQFNTTGNISITKQFSSLGDNTISLNYSGNDNWTQNIQNWNVTVKDLTPPTFNQTLTTLNINFGQGAKITVNASDNFKLDNYTINTTRFSIDGTGFLQNVSPLEASTFIINVTINDSSNNLATTTWTVNVAKISSSIQLAINGTQGNVTGGQYNFTRLAVNRTAGEGTTELYIDTSLLNSTTPDYITNYNLSTSGVKNITAIQEATQNYTRSSVTYNITVIPTAAADTTKPIINVSADKTVTFGQYNLQEWFNASDDVGIDTFTINDTVNFNINRTGYLTNITMLRAGVFKINVTVNDTSNNVNSTIWTLTINKAQLINGNLNIAPSSSITYGTESTITGSETNGYDGDVTYTLFNQNGSVANPFTGTLAVGQYNFSYNGTAGQNYTANTTLATGILTVNKNNSLVELYLNSTRGNITGEVERSINISGKKITGDSGAVIKVYNNNNLIYSGLAQSSNITNFTVAGVYNITVIYEATQNYTQRSETWNYTVINTTVPDTTPPSLTAPSNLSKVWNSSISVTFSASDNVGVDSFFVNSTSLFSINRVTGVLTNTSQLKVGVHTVNVSVNDTSNNVNSTIYQVTISKAPSVVRLLLNGTNGAKTIPNATAANLTGYLLIGNLQENIQLYVNGTLWNQGVTPLENISTFNITATYPINLTYIGNENFTGVSQQFNLNVEVVTAVNGSIVNYISPNFPVTVPHIRMGRRLVFT